MRSRAGPGPELNYLSATECRSMIFLMRDHPRTLTAPLSALRESEERFRSAFNHAPIGMALVSLDGRWLQVNRSLCRIVGYSADELLITDFQSITCPDDLDANLDSVERLIAGEISDYQMAKRYIHRQGHLVWVLLNVSLVRDERKKPLYFVSQIQDITQRKHAEWLEEDRLRVLEMVARDLPLPEVLAHLAEAVERQIGDTMAAAMVVQEGDVCLRGAAVPQDWMKALQERCLSLASALSKNIWADPDRCGVTFIGSDPLWQALRPIAASHGLAACWAMAVQSTDGSTLGLLTVFCRQPRRPTPSEIQTLDMAAKLATICIDHHNTTRQLAHLVRHDPLTGLPNRIMFEDRFQQGLALARRNGRSACVMLLDIDRFKTINDTLGHHAGDHLLQQFAHRLRGRLRETDTMARLGGDEFAVFLPELAGREQAVTVAGKLIESLTEPFQIGERSLSATTSIGIALFPDDAPDALTLQQKADAALYRAKERGRNGYSF